MPSSIYSPMLSLIVKTRNAHATQANKSNCPFFLFFFVIRIFKYIGCLLL